MLLEAQCFSLYITKVFKSCSSTMSLGQKDPMWVRSGMCFLGLNTGVLRTRWVCAQLHSSYRSHILVISATFTGLLCAFGGFLCRNQHAKNAFVCIRFEIAGCTEWKLEDTSSGARSNINLMQCAIIRFSGGIIYVYESPIFQK